MQRQTKTHYAAALNLSEHTSRTVDYAVCRLKNIITCESTVPNQFLEIFKTGSEPRFCNMLTLDCEDMHRSVIRGLLHRPFEGMPTALSIILVNVDMRAIYILTLIISSISFSVFNSKYFILTCTFTLFVATLAFFFSVCCFAL